MRARELLATVGLLLLALSSQAAEQVQVVGLFPGAAVVNVDGQRKLVKVGQTGPGGVQVVSADSRGAVLRVNGVERAYSLSRESSAGFSVPTKAQTSIARGADGHYRVVGSVAGQSVAFLVDTGATSLALNETQARRLGIDFRVQGEAMIVNLAKGTARAWRVKLPQVKVGPLEVLGVEAFVLEGEGANDALLGMSFLNRVRWHEDQGVLVLESKF
ncbi:MAG: TIGR02281 family clan AA aspartic protease [Pseudomonas sp.]|uniref:retropepsin-like aspartic protease family protein n=1 Tax=Pseudomonas sp. TaxID=306 RepID=UPI003BB79799